MAAQSNPGKQALILGVVLALAGAGMGAYTHFTTKLTIPDTEITGAKLKEGELVKAAEKLQAVLSEKRVMADFAPKGVMIGDKPRITPFLFPPEIWQVSLDKESRNAMLDIYDPKAVNIHDPIPNLWFFENGLHEELGLANGAKTDSDKDGFSNLVEYQAKTNPMDAKEYPALISADGPVKMKVSKIVTSRAIITTDSMLAYETEEPAEVNIKIFANAADITPVAKYTLKKGDSFGVNAKEKDRFTVAGFEVAEYPDSQDQMAKEMTMKLIDNSAPEGAQDFTVRAGKPRANEKVKENVKGLLIMDTVVTFTVTAGTEKGKPSGVFKTASDRSFTIPGGDKTSYIIEAIAKDGSVTVRKDGEGETSTITIPKGI